MEKKNLAVELLERLLKGKIKAQTGTKMLARRQHSLIESSQVIEEMIQMA